MDLYPFFDVCVTEAANVWATPKRQRFGEDLNSARRHGRPPRIQRRPAYTVGDLLGNDERTLVKNLRWQLGAAAAARRKR
jgi:hypothetical protein